MIVLFAINTMNFFDRQILGAIGEPIRKEFGLDDASLGLLGTAAALADPDTDEHGRILEAARRPQRVRQSAVVDNDF